MKILILFSIMIFLIFLPHIVEATNGWAIYTNTTFVGSAVMRNWTGDAIEAGVATGTDSGGARSWQKLRCIEKRQECLLIWNDADNDISFEILNTTSLTWSGYIELEGSANNDDTQNFDVECEDSSGECLVVYDDSGTDNQQIAYRVYNNSGLNAEEILTIGSAAGLADWIRLYSKNNSDEIMLVMADDNLAISAILWNGTSNSFKSTAQVITLVAPLLNRKSFDFAWEGSSGEGLLAFGNTTDGLFGFTYINYAWTNIGLLYNNGAQAYTIHMCGSNPLMGGTNHDYIGIMIVDQDSDLTGGVWNGTAIEAGQPTEDASTEGVIPTENIQCMWGTTSKNQAVFIWVNNGALTPFGGTYTIGTGWSFADWNAGSSTGMTTWQDDVDDLHLLPNPVSDEMFIIGQDLAEDIECMRWTGSAWDATSCGLLESNAPSSLFESDTFDWSRYTPPPDTTPPTWSSPSVNVTNPHRGEPVNISTLWQDTGVGLNKAWLSTNETSTWVNYTDGTYGSPRSLSGTNPVTVNFTWITTGRPRVIGWIIYANDTNGYTNGTNNPSGTYQGNFTMWGWSNITWTSPSGSVSGIVALTCFVNDTNTTGSGPIGNYTVNFYNRTSSTESLLGTNYTNSYGYAVYYWNTAGLTAGSTYYPKCNITSNSTLYYNVSEYYQANTTITIDTPPTYSLNSTNSTAAGAAIEHRLRWNDTVGLSGYIFQFCNGTWDGTNCLDGGSQNWWDSNWKRRVQLNITEINNTARTYEPIDKWINFTSLSSGTEPVNCTKEIRVTNCSDASCTSEVEIYSQVYNETYSGGICQACNVVFLANVSANGNAWFRVYYNYSGASYPGYTNINVVGNNLVYGDYSTFTGVNDRLNFYAGGTLCDITNVSNPVDGWTYSTNAGYGDEGGLLSYSTNAVPYYVNLDSFSYVNGPVFIQFNMYNASYGTCNVTYYKGQTWFKSLMNKTQADWTTFDWEMQGSMELGTATGGGAQFNINATGDAYRLAGTSSSVYYWQTYINKTGRLVRSAWQLSADAVDWYDNPGYTPADPTVRSLVGYWFTAGPSITTAQATAGIQKVQYSPTTALGSTETYGGWVNDTWASFGGGTWSNVTKVVNSTAGATIAWCVYANDTSNNWNGTSYQNPFSYTTTSACSVAIGFSNTLADGVTFGSVTQGQTKDASGNNGASATDYYVSVQISGCTPSYVDVYMKANDFTNGSYTIAVSNEKFRNSTTDTVPATLTNVSLSTNWALVGNDLANGEIIYLKYLLTVPSPKTAGIYNNTVNIWGGRNDLSPT